MADNSQVAIAPEPVVSVPPQKHFLALDGLRGVAILLVFFRHYGGGHKSHNPIVHAWSMLADSGWMGVDLFFVLSGFLITGILYDSADKVGHVKNFYIRRALRIFPLFYGVLFVALLLGPVLHMHWRAIHVVYFLYCANLTWLLPNFQGPGGYIGLEHFWSLAVEEQFYLLWPFVVWHLRDRKKLIGVAITVIVLEPILRAVLWHAGFPSLNIHESLFTRADSLLWGGLLALLVRGTGAKLFPVRRVLAVSGVLLLAIFLVDGNALPYSVLINTVGFSVIAAFAAGLVYLAWRGTGVFARVMKNGFLRACGRYSYGLYVYHGALLPLLYRQLPRIETAVHSAALGGALFLILSISLTVLVTVLSYHLFEEPILRLKNRFA